MFSFTFRGMHKILLMLFLIAYKLAILSHLCQSHFSCYMSLSVLSNNKCSFEYLVVWRCLYYTQVLFMFMNFNGHEQKASHFISCQERNICPIHYHTFYYLIKINILFSL